MKTQYKRILVPFIALVSILTVGLAPSLVAAGSFTNSTLELSRLATSANSSVRLIFQTATSTSSASTLTVNMNGADSTTWIGQGGSVAASQTTSVATCPGATGATALPGSITAAGSGSSITISSVGNLAASTLYCVDLTGAAVTNPTSTGQFHPTITESDGDAATVAVNIITNDQVVVSATVPPTFTFALSANTDSFTNVLSPSSAVQTSGISVTIGTNAVSGWFLWGNDSNTGLLSTSRGHTIASTTPGTAATLSNGSEGYLTGVTSITQGTGAGTTTATAAYDGSGGAGHGSGLDSTLRKIASSNGTANGAAVTLKESATISAITPSAADYTDTITLVGAGSF